MAVSFNKPSVEDPRPLTLAKTTGEPNHSAGSVVSFPTQPRGGADPAVDVFAVALAAIEQVTALKLHEMRFVSEGTVQRAVSVATAGAPESERGALEGAVRDLVRGRDEAAVIAEIEADLGRALETARTLARTHRHSLGPADIYRKQLDDLVRTHARARGVDQDAALRWFERAMGSRRVTVTQIAYPMATQKSGFLDRVLGIFQPKDNG